MPISQLKFALAASMAFTCAGTAALAEFETNEPFVVVWEAKGTGIRFDIKQSPRGVHGLVLKIKGPKRYQAMVMSKEQGPSIDLREFGKVFDGVYRYDITGATDEKIEVNTTIDENGRDEAARGYVFRSVAASGSFQVREGAIFMFEDKKED